MDGLRKTLEVALNVYNAESASNTPDYILAQYLTDCLAAFDKAVKLRAQYYDPMYRGSAKLDAARLKRDCKT